jgi:hypothetical protein
MRAMLKHLATRGCFVARGGIENDAGGRIIKVGWVNAGMALKLAYGNVVGFDLWGETHIDVEARTCAPGQWVSFDPEARPGHVTIGTLIKAAKDAGFALPMRKTVAAQTGGAPAAQSGHSDDADPMKVAIEELNLRYFVARLGGGVFVFDQEDQNILTGAMSFVAFRQFHAGRKIGGEPIVKIWLTRRVGAPSARLYSILPANATRAATTRGAAWPSSPSRGGAGRSSTTSTTSGAAGTRRSSSMW